MDMKFSELNIVRKSNPQILTLRLSSKLPSLYTFIHFWGRLPNYLLDDLIENYKNNKKVLFDPFGGSGSVIFRGLEAGFQKIIYNDLNPTFAFITRTIYDSLSLPRRTLFENINELKKELIENSVILDILRVNKKSNFIYKVAYDQNLTLRKISEDIDVNLKTEALKKTAGKIIRILKNKKSIKFSELRNKVINCLSNYNKVNARGLFSFVLNKLVERKIVQKKIVEDHLIISSSITFPKNTSFETSLNKIKILRNKEDKYKHLIKKEVFSYSLKYNNGNAFKKADNIRTLGDLYPNWTKIILSIIWDEINEFSSSDEKLINIFKLCFLASLYDTSRMQMPHKSGWIIKAFWVPPIHAAKNPLYVFFRKLNQFLCVYDSLKEKMTNSTMVRIYSKDIFEFSGREIRDKPDIVITHPPYFSTVQYGELSTIWASWLKYKIPFDKEIVENIRQGKDKKTYLQLLKTSLEKICKLSDKNAEIVLIFQSKKERDWKLLDEILSQLPLKLIQIRCYRRNGCWGSKHIFNIGDFDYALIFKKWR